MSKISATATRPTARIVKAILVVLLLAGIAYTARHGYNLGRDYLAYTHKRLACSWLNVAMVDYEYSEALVAFMAKRCWQYDENHSQVYTSAVKPIRETHTTKLLKSRNQHPPHL